MATRRELVESVGARYRASTVAEGSAILDEFVSIAGYHRKHAIRLLSAPATAPEARLQLLRARSTRQFNPSALNAACRTSP